MPVCRLLFLFSAVVTVALSLGQLSWWSQLGMKLTPTPIRANNSSKLRLYLLKEAYSAAKQALDDRKRYETLLLSKGVSLPATPPGQVLFPGLDAVFPLTLQITDQAVILEELSKYLTLRLGKVQNITLRGSDLTHLCPVQPTCHNAKYPSVDGSCNNLAHPTWGKSFTAVNRLLPPAYKDGVSIPRGTNDTTLPNPRVVRLTSIRDAPIAMDNVTSFFMSWGNFMLHETILSPLFSGINGSFLTCCSPEIRRNPELRHPECHPIEIPIDDPFYSDYDQTCMEFVRTAPAPRHDCSLGPRTAVNMKSAYIDASVIYGSEERTSRMLRTFQQGRLISQSPTGKEIPPSHDGMFVQGQLPDFRCQSEKDDEYCVLAGDILASSQPHITTFHILLLREHNYLVTELARMNPRWDDEILYQEARRIIAAQLQHITYNEYLPILLGRETMEKYNLSVAAEGFSYSYDPTIDASPIDEFTVAAYRFGHSTVPDAFHLMRNGSVLGKVQVRDSLFRPYDPHTLDRYIEGGVSVPSNAVDDSITNELTEHLFERPKHPFGLDLASLNVHRGRERGIRPYNDYRDFCNHNKAHSFQHLQKSMHARTVENLKKLYRSVDDIDAWVGGISEIPLPGAAVGPTFACIIAEQFRRWKLGDRFFYENGGMRTSFTQGQLAELRTVSLARLFCDFSDNIRYIQPQALLLPSDRNAVVSCDGHEIPKMNLLPWKTY